MKAVHGQVTNIKKIPSRQIVQVITEIPAEHYAAAVALLDDHQALITPSALKIPFGVVDGQAEEDEEPAQSAKGGELSKWSAMRCKESDFRWWLSLQLKRHCETEEDAKQLICHFCGITSRRELDHNAKANQIFKDMILRPWQAHCGEAA